MSSIKELEKNKIEYVQCGEYLKADEVKEEIRKLRTLEKEEKKNIIKNSNRQTLTEIESNYKQDLNDVLSFYTDKITHFVDEAKQAEQEMAELHQQKMEEYIVELENSIPKKVKFSNKYLNLKQKEKNALKYEDFIEAHFYQKQCETLCKEETEKYNKNREQKMLNFMKSLKEKQDKEKNSLKQKLDREYEEILSEKQRQVDYVNQNYKNKILNIKNHK